MITPYAFDNANLDGDKEAVIIPNVPTLVNKLSAKETNGIKDKLNETISRVNELNADPVAYLELRVKLKGFGNVLPTIQVGDIVHGFADANTIWTSARFEGGDPTDRDNYTPLIPAEPVSFTALSTDAGQAFVLPFNFTAGSVLRSRAELYKGTEWTQSGNTLTILVSLTAGNTVYAKP